MKINNKFYYYIKPVLIKLKEKIGDNFVVFGSVPLYLLGVVDFNSEINDLDIAVKDVNVIPEEAKKVTFENKPKQNLYKIIINNIEVDIGGCWLGQEDYFYKLFIDPIEVDGFKFANLEILEEWKERML